MEWASNSSVPSRSSSTISSQLKSRGRPLHHANVNLPSVTPVETNTVA